MTTTRKDAHYTKTKRKNIPVEFIAKTKEGIVEIKAIPPRHIEIEGPGGRIRGMATLTI